MQWPLLDLKSIHHDVQRNVAELELHVETLLDESDGVCPVDGMDLLAKIMTVRRLVSQMLSPALRAAIADEQQVWDDFEAMNPH